MLFIPQGVGSGVFFFSCIALWFGTSVTRHSGAPPRCWRQVGTIKGGNGALQASNGDLGRPPLWVTRTQVSARAAYLASQFWIGYMLARWLLVACCCWMKPCRERCTISVLQMWCAPNKMADRYVHLGGDEAEQFRSAAYRTTLGKRAKVEAKIWNDEKLQVCCVPNKSVLVYVSHCISLHSLFTLHYSLNTAIQPEWRAAPHKVGIGA